jgi:hypothetical protein
MQKIPKNKEEIIRRFQENIKNVEICLDGENINHCGREGHWLEIKMGLSKNPRNEPDLYGYEMKKSANKITLGDFSASEYAFSRKRDIINKTNQWTKTMKMSRTEFIEYFGNPNPNKNDRYSWSGSCVPKYNVWNECGQKIIISKNNDIIIYYSYKNDKRDRKIHFPRFLQTKTIIIAIWTAQKMEKHINTKFNNNGFFLCKKNGDKYSNICFGRPFDFDYFIKSIKNKKIYFDSGMYEGNARNYSQWRAAASFWNNMITEEY